MYSFSYAFISMYQMFHYSIRIVLKHILYNQPMGCPYNIYMQLAECVIIKAVTPHGKKIHIQVICFRLLTVWEDVRYYRIGGAMI